MQDALEAVRLALVKRWPDSKVHLFGSTANQLSICNNNDIDVCLELPDLQTDTVRPFPEGQHAADMFGFVLHLVSIILEQALRRISYAEVCVDTRGQVAE